MLSEDLALRLRAAGLRWTPMPGDRFTVPDAEGDDVFTLAEMVIETEDVPGGRIVKFNGTTEWALDSLDADRALWLPREDQLRTHLARRFARLESLPDGFVVVLEDASRHADTSAEGAYARAVLHALAADGAGPGEPG